MVIFNYVTDDEAEPITLYFKGCRVYRPSPRSRFVGTQELRDSARLLHSHCAARRGGDAGALEVTRLVPDPKRVDRIEFQYTGYIPGVSYRYA